MGVEPREAAWASLHGLALGDGLGSQFFVPDWCTTASRRRGSC
jgi:hypothetical protein